ncbi:MAG: nitrate reductase subunit beta [Candidatus Abyssobacteria bacterium SURF_5]|uniref:Nitrate reductase subunit beta n=1 Tax=Abyssobacteria bacterium (strain SURF_5) TaxID=2093360 RepID=A0A3A4P5X0_ABYX5|nr:MAG: nitrate reductase subunit beta [Candidatus Abyssubacteria bacterium SURF_5]
MNIRAQISMVFHLDKCIGCHTCSIACKNIWTTRRGTEYMWWNNVETKPGVGYPMLYEDQSVYRGGWEMRDGKLSLKLHGRTDALKNIFFNQRLPHIGDYYEPFTFTYRDILNSNQGADQPAARPVSQISGKPIDIQSSGAWDDNLGGSPIYAENDPTLAALTPEERKQLFELERLVFFYLPRICNHCLNPGCVGACPAGAIYKRGEDGIVLVSQDKCRGWRMCVSGCPYKKVYYNWETGKAEKCILCYPRQETQQAPACMHACVGRIRYLGVLLYDADRIEEAASAPDGDLVRVQRDIILSPFDPKIIRQAQADRVHDKIIDAAQRSPVYRYVKEWGLALPHRPDFRTVPMLFYVPSLLPVIGHFENGAYELADSLFSSLENDRLPVKYWALLLAGGNEEIVTEVFRKMIAGRIYKRAESVGDISMSDAEKAVQDAGLTVEQVKDIYQLTSLSLYEQRFVVPPFLREGGIEEVTDPQKHMKEFGAGRINPADRRW